MWFERKLQGNVHLEKMVNEAQEWVGKLMWVSRLDRQVEVDRERMVWELIGRLSVEHVVVEVWWSGGHSTCRKLESAQMRVGRRLLGVSNTVAGVAVQGDLEWRRLVDRREEMRKCCLVRYWKGWKRVDW